MNVIHLLQAFRHVKDGYLVDRVAVADGRAPHPLVQLSEAAIPVRAEVLEFKPIPVRRREEARS